FRSGFRSARLYSMIVSPEHRGRGVARALLAEAEAAARERGSVSLRLEVREDNRPAIALYESEGYEAVGAAPAYYEDGGGAIRMVKRFLPGSSTLLGVPFCGQTLDFNCGPACLMMAMRHHGYPVPLERWLELTLWREATTVFMTSGHGGCSAHGLAVAALRRGFQATVATRDAGVPFLDSVRSEAKKEVIALAHETFEREIKALGAHVALVVNEVKHSAQSERPRGSTNRGEFCERLPAPDVQGQALRQGGGEHGQQQQRGDGLER